MKLPGRSAWALTLIAVVGAAARFAALPQAGPERLTPDGARFLNLARSLERGLGYVTPEAWPAWLAPEKLPAPESFKEPGYPYAIAAATPLAGDPFRAARAVSLAAGVLVPLATWALARALAAGATAALLAGLLAAASPVLIRQSVLVMAESPFALFVTAAFALAACRPRADARGGATALLAGLALGLAYLVRAQALVAAPVVVALIAARRAPRAALPAAALALAGAALVALPWWLRNHRLFGDPFHSDVAVFAIWPYVDQFAFSHSLDRPPDPFAYASAHAGEVLRFTLGSLRRFLWHTVPHDLLGSRIWLVPLAIGGGLALARARAWWPLLAFAAMTAALMLPLHWVPRYFAAVAPLVCVWTALGTAWLLEDQAARPAFGRVPTGAVAWLGIAALLALGIGLAWRTAGETFRPELAEARAAGPVLRARLAPDEAVMAEMTSYWAWHADRPAVHPVVAGDRALREVARRLHVKAAALTPEFEREYAARLDGGRLPEWFVPIAAPEVAGVRLYALRPDSLAVAVTAPR